ncbi:MAG TPA: 3-dehydroquinate synthase [Alphaproteobacteria bacterium]|nr:3-dehydroquinate synthase [Alphaproteobacteria bacterium]
MARSNSDTPADPVAPAVPRTIVFVGLMGAGKSAIGRRLAQRLGVPFTDADHEIEAAAGRSVEEIFDTLGEQAFREGERKIVQRLLDAPTQVLSTGGGAFIDPETRAKIKARGISVWLDADLDLLLRRVARRNNRPLLKRGDPREVLSRLMAERNPIYAQADIRVESVDGPPEATVERVAEALRRYLAGEARIENVTQVRVELGARGYDVHIGAGLLDRVGQLVLPLLRERRLIVVSDVNVARTQWPRAKFGLDAAGVAAQLIEVAPGEGAKDFAHLQSLVERVLDLKPDRGAMLMALGGGVVGDLTGFAASLVLRGIDYVQAPTTLLAQVDSSVGGKTGINTRHGKNLVGAFHQPRMVVADLDALKTLSARELRAGYAEIVKYGLIDDADFFAWLEANGSRVLAGDSAAQSFAVARSVRAKARIVAADEREAGRRALLNLGHTFGHALEAATGFGEALLHGEAVAIGITLAFELSARLGLCATGDAERVRRHLEAVGLPTALARADLGRLDANSLIASMAHDKKARGGAAIFILARGIGEAFVARDVDPAALRALLADAVAA